MTRTRVRTVRTAATATLLASALVFALTSCASSTAPTTWDQDNATITIGKASENLQLWLQLGAPNTATFLRANSTQLTTWQDSGTLKITYHPISVPDSTEAERDYAHIAGSALAAVAQSHPDKVIDAMVKLGGAVVDNGTVPSEDAVQTDLKAAGITVDVPRAVKKYGEAIRTATIQNGKSGPIRSEPSAILDGTFLNVGHNFVTEVSAALQRSGLLHG